MADLLVELYSEPIPARMQAAAAEMLKTLAAAALLEANLAVTEIATHVTSRRLVLAIEGLPKKTEAVHLERRGPRSNASPEVLRAFAQSVGVAEKALKVKSTDKGEYYFANITTGGERTADILGTLVEKILNNVTWPKTMRWGYGYFRWVRPLKRVLALFDGSLLPLTVGPCNAEALSNGHSMMSLPPFAVSSFQDYHENLRQRCVILERSERIKIINQGAMQLAEQHHLHFHDDKELIEELAGLSEWPVVLLGRIDAEYLQLPPQILTTSMRHHQKYLPLHTKQGDLAPFFVMVADITTTGDMTRVIAGNERVLRARLEDARFFYDQDRKMRLEDRVKQLKRITFHAKLGTMADKTERISELATFLSFWIPRASLKDVERAARLCKTDLVTQVVGEFPELQGVMGYYYALADQEGEKVAQAIWDHYSPLGPDDSCPNKPESIAVAMADKVDTLTGLFIIQEKPTGSKDPYALRRAALGVIRLILENQLRVPLKVLFDKAFNIYPSNVHLEEEKKVIQRHKRVVNELLSFFYDRLKALLKARDIRYDIINALFEVYEPDDDIARVVNKAMAMEEFLRTTPVEIIQSFKRLSSILANENLNKILMFKKHASEDKLEEKEEFNLFETFHMVVPEVERLTKEEDFSGLLKTLTTLAQPIHQFLDNVMVNVDELDLKKNRIRLLAEIHELLYEVYNFDAIEIL